MSTRIGVTARTVPTRGRACDASPVRRAIVVLGQSRRGPGGYGLSRGCLERLRRSEALADGAVAVVLAGGGPGARTEAEQMRDAWRGPDVELVLEPYSGNTAENAALVLPLLRERRVDSALVVAAPVHLPRVRYLFDAVFRESGIDVEYVAAGSLPTPYAVAWELGGWAKAWRDRRHALQLTRIGDEPPVA
jgi:uncharacterized SAM-binding protein YcdF (DUF218 family)